MWAYIFVSAAWELFLRRPADALREELFKIRVGVAAVAEDGAEHAGFFLRAIPRQPFVAGLQQRRGIPDHVHVVIQFVVQHPIRQARRDGMMSGDDGDGDVYVALVSRGGDAAGHLFVETNIFAAGDALVFRPHRIRKVGVMQHDYADAFVEQREEARLLRVGNVAGRIVKHHDVVAGHIVAVITFGGLDLFVGGEGDFGIVRKEFEERFGLETVAAGEHEDFDFFIGVMIG